MIICIRYVIIYFLKKIFTEKLLLERRSQIDVKGICSFATFYVNLIDMLSAKWGRLETQCVQNKIAFWGRPDDIVETVLGGSDRGRF